MNRHSDGFSDNSYEELLREYAGKSLTSKPAKNNNDDFADTRFSSHEKDIIKPKRTDYASAFESRESKVESYEEPTFNIDISKRKKASSFSLDIGEISRTDKKSTSSGTMEFSKPKTEQSVNQRSKYAPVIEKKYDSISERPPVREQPTAGRQTTANTSRPSSANIGNKINTLHKRRPQSSSDANGGKKKFKIDGKMIALAFKQNKKAFISFAACFIVAFIISAATLSCINDILAINRNGEEVIEVVLPNDADTKTAVKALDDAGLIKNRIFCNMFLKIMNYKDDNYLPGVYYFTESMGLEKMIMRFKTSNKRGALVSVTIPEGYTIDQIFARLEKNEICTASALYKTIDSVDFSAEYDFIKNLENKEDRYHILEGYMFPATYEFEQGADPASVIREFLNAFKARWTDDYAKRAAELSLSTDDVIRIASIIEKEAYGSDQFALVSSVLHNRLNRSGVYATLDCDSTKEYVTKTIADRVSSTSQINSYVNKYNTYECAGLPVGAICNPGNAAIEAALHPDTNQYYFFRHDKNRKIYMAKTIEEHNANARTVNQVNAQED